MPNVYTIKTSCGPSLWSIWLNSISAIFTSETPCQPISRVTTSGNPLALFKRDGHFHIFLTRCKTKTLYQQICAITSRTTPRSQRLIRMSLLLPVGAVDIPSWRAISVETVGGGIKSGLRQAIVCPSLHDYRADV